MIAIDGKTVRGARTRPDGAAPHLVAAFDHDAGVVLGQLAVAAKSNEIPCVRDLLACFDLTDTIVTLDAMHTQTDTATAITGAGGHYVLTVKGNTPTLRRKLKALPWKDIPAHSVTETGHGRRVTRTIKVAAVPDWIEFPGAAQVAHVRRTVTTKGHKTVEVVYLITSADPPSAPPATLAAWVQGHWAIEDKLHWVRDVTFGEDDSQVRTGQAPRVMATLRNTAISLLRLAGWDNIAKALRHHARDPQWARRRGQGNCRVREETGRYGLPRQRAPGKPVVTVNLNFRKVSDAGMRQLATFKNLTELYLIDAPITDAGMKQLATLKYLTTLTIEGTQVTDVGLTELAPLTNLTSLDIARTQVTDTGIKQLSVLKNLTKLDIGHTQVTDIGLKDLAPLKNLTTLNLFSVKVTDAGLKELAALKNLNTLYLNYTQVNGGAEGTCTSHEPHRAHP